MKTILSFLPHPRLACCLAACLLAAARSGAAEAADTGDKQVQAIITRWLEALGGARRIAQLKTVDYRCRINFGPGLEAVETEVRAHAGGAYRYDYELPAFGRLTQAFDGRFTWQRNAVLGFGQLSAADHYANLAGTDLQAPLRAAKQFAMRRLPEETIDGRTLQVLELTDRAGGKGKWYFDPATGLRVRIEVTSPAGAMIVENADFREVPGAGVKDPFRIRRTANGHTVDITMQEIRYNDDLDQELFNAPLAALEDNQEIERILRSNRELTGVAALEKVQTRVTTQLVEVTTSGLKIPTKVWQKQPNLMRVEQTVPGMGAAAQGFDGKIGWAWSELEGFRTMAGAELQQMLASTDIAGPLRLSEACPLRRLLEEKEENGRSIVGIAMATPAGPAGNFYFDTRDFTLVRLETFMQAGASGQLKVTAEFSDFRKVDGIRMPFVTVFTNPAVRSVCTIQSVQHNVPIDDAIFRPRKE